MAEIVATQDKPELKALLLGIVPDPKAGNRAILVLEEDHEMAGGERGDYALTSTILRFDESEGSLETANTRYRVTLADEDARARHRFPDLVAHYTARSFARA